MRTAITAHLFGCFVAVALAFAPSDLLAWGSDGHHAVGAIADQVIQGSNAEREVKALLGGLTLQEASVWADCAKGIDPRQQYRYGPRGKYPECAIYETDALEAQMRDYVRRNDAQCNPRPGEEVCHKQYHYADVATLHSAYSRGLVGTGDHDVVAAIGAAVEMLVSGTSRTPFSFRDKREALLVLVHFVGDIHQPLHVGAIYLDAQGRIVDPDNGAFDEATRTIGGNAIHIGHENLHRHWDEIPTQLTARALSGGFLDGAQHAAVTPGDFREWPSIWATESIKRAAIAYGSLKFGARSGTGHSAYWDTTLPASYDGAANCVNTTLPASYDSAANCVKESQIASAGAHLAQLLKAIWPDNVVAAVAALDQKQETQCTIGKFCYCVNAQLIGAITDRVAYIREHIRSQRGMGKAIGYMSIPLSSVGGGYFTVNAKVAGEVKQYVEGRLGGSRAWMLNPAATEFALPRGASGADYMLMWTQVFEGEDGLGRDFDFAYFVGPAAFQRHFKLDGHADMEKLDRAYEELSKSDSELRKIDKKGFREYYSLRASVAFSYGSHDEWNIARAINERRRGDAVFGYGGQLGVFFDGQQVPPSVFEEAISTGNAAACRN